ncbi:hypothetical protein XENTR_v10012944 [Xenopus tropicalis]|uniref:Protein ATP6V1FNB n=1 Tax=Xenopus tropicalis TaxID=8364 RepID=A0A1B8Y6H2_XENTR|nr:protein ATP6V1FNB [Xenopus tropicalis]KAE8612676.1 hypothetical protein XENTR_v10012944 [Xenopus tropicalis]|eukprot:XP_012817237.1 PREDICTED: uncharacterized protein LOC105947030 [Xenopus tropicalis]
MKELLTTRNQNCWKELIEKETASRMYWKLRYKEEHPQNPPERSRKRKEGSLPNIGTTLLPPINVPKRLVVKPPEEPACGLPEEGGLGEMRAATPRTSRLLYDGFSKEGKGRSLYLRRRKELSPEQKYPHPMLSSWDYGWRLDEMVGEVKAPVQGRCKIVRDTFYSRNGVVSLPQFTDRML